MGYLRAIGVAGFILLFGILLSVISVGLALPIALPLMLLGFVMLFMGLERRLQTDEAHGKSKSAQYDHWFSRINFVLGVWLIAVPFLLNYAVPGDLSVEMSYGTDVNILASPLWNEIIVGVLISIFAAVRAFDVSRARAWSWANMVLGAWLVASPFVLGYAREMQQAFLNDVIIGVLVVGLSLASTAVMRSSPHPRSSLN